MFHPAQPPQQVEDPFPEMTVLQIFRDLEWNGPTEWEEACLTNVVIYMRLAKSVKIPEEFKPLIPKCAMHYT